MTGNPIRSSIQPLPSATRDPFTIFVFGGSQGAAGINSMVLEALPHLHDLKHRIRWIHQTGERDFDRVAAGHKNDGSGARVEKFIYEMPKAYGEASLLVCRAGSSTLAEVAGVGRAAVLVPFPFASDNHQEKNARIFVDAGAARLLLQGKGKGEELARLIRELMNDSSQLDAMENAVKKFYRPNAAEDIAKAFLG